MSKTSSRREFLRQSAATGLGIASAGLLPTFVSAAQPKSKIIQVRNTGALTDSPDSPGGAVRLDTAARMIDQAVAKLAGQSDAQSAWKSLFKPDDVVGIKVNCLFGKGASTHPEIATAVGQALVRAGVKPENVIIWDRSTGDLLKSGFKINRDGPGVKVIANDGEWDEPTKLGSFSGRLTKIVTQQITAMINIPIMKDHGIAGISGAMKNHYGTCDDPGSLHGNHCDPYLADLNAVPAIKNKTRLIIMDALRPMADGGPGLRRAALWDYHTLLVSQDPVAMDYLAWKTIEERRQTLGLKSLAESGRGPAWIATAASRGLGTDNPANIQVVRI